MPVDEVRLSPWTRKHDDPRFNLIPQAPKIVYPKSLEELIELRRYRPAAQRFKAAGSHWALSEAAISDHTFIETHDPRNVHRAMGKTLTNVIPRCLNRDYVEHMVESERQTQKSYLVHIEAGKRIYQLYAELDQLVDVGDTSTLAEGEGDVCKPIVEPPGPASVVCSDAGQTLREDRPVAVHFVAEEPPEAQVKGNGNSLPWQVG
jgi:hypothetical protein